MSFIIMFVLNLLPNLLFDFNHNRDRNKASSPCCIHKNIAVGTQGEGSVVEPFFL